MQQILLNSTLSIILFCAGCIPVHYTPRPGVAGKVIDADSGVPVIDAKISICLKLAKQKEPATVNTIQDGTFCIPPKQQWGLYIIPMDVFPWPFILSVEKDGYLPLTQDFQYAQLGEPPSMNFGQLLLKQKKE